MFRSRRPVRRKGATFVIDLDESERKVLGSLLDELRGLLDGDPNDPRIRRLYPTAYAEDPDREAEYRLLAHSELVEKRLATLDVVAETIDRNTLDEDGLASWMNAVNQLRLVLGTMLDVDEDPDPVSPDDPDAASYALYEWLGWLLEHMVRALSS
ncbi:MAG: DUF2017 family protein [Actinomycetota bacterium]|nr:DUF2017 family protein [Actinomycetota bacterium]